MAHTEHLPSDALRQYHQRATEMVQLQANLTEGKEVGNTQLVVYPLALSQDEAHFLSPPMETQRQRERSTHWPNVMKSLEP